MEPSPALAFDELENDVCSWSLLLGAVLPHKVISADVILYTQWAQLRFQSLSPEIQALPVELFPWD